MPNDGEGGIGEGFPPVESGPTPRAFQSARPRPPLSTQASSSSKRPLPVTLLLLGLLFHLVYLWSIFDIYFVSPVIRVDRRFGGVDDGQLGKQWEGAKRVVLIVGDGLRADKLFKLYPHDYQALPLPSNVPSVSLPHSKIDPQLAGEYQKATTARNNGRDWTAAPYVRALITAGRAAWGVSHTRVPTESRPGHVALLAGMYEDVSAVTRGWKVNPVTFDSVLNQSTHTFAFGSPDIVPMFRHGVTGAEEKIDMWCYEGENEDFTQDAVQLDIWVLDRLKALLRSPSPAQRAALDSPHGTFFFLHLLGLDTTGHSYRPHSPEYHRNIVVVDRVVQSVVHEIEAYFGDKDTAYVFTADHGMSTLGNHGDGDPDNTRTPIVVWGKGVRNAAELATRTNELEEKDEYYSGWDLWRRKRLDMEQADVAPLMASLLSVPLPANSVGRLPVDYLDFSPSGKARAARANALEVLEQYRVSHARRAAITLNYKPFSDLPDGGTERSARVDALIASGRFDVAEAESMELVDIALRGLKYLHTYDWVILRTIVVTGYIGWMLVGTQFILRSYVFLDLAPRPLVPSVLLVTIPSTTFFVIGAKFVREQAPPSFYAYAALPALFWTMILRDLAPFARLLSSTTIPVILVSLAALILSLLAMASGYFQRAVWSGGFFLLGAFWPVLGMPSDFRSANKAIGGAWTVLCFVTSVFTLLPVEKGESLPVIMSGGAIFVLIGALAIKQSLPFTRSPPASTGGIQGLKPIEQRVHTEKELQFKSHLEHTTTTLKAQIVLTALSMIVTFVSARSLQLRNGLPRTTQVLGWVIFATSSVIPFLRARRPDQHYSHRLLILTFSFAPVFVILSLSYEILFYFFFAATLSMWLIVESRLSEFTAAQARLRQPKPQASKGTATHITMAHVRISLFFLFFIHVGFFGTGNVASISSFYLEPVYRLVPVFNPFLMSALLLYKILIPFLLVSAVFSILNARLGLPPFALFLTSVTMSDVLTLAFFFQVTDAGSWLEIGRSISHFVIASLLLIFNAGLYFVGDSVTRNCRVK